MGSVLGQTEDADEVQEEEVEGEEELLVVVTGKEPEIAKWKFYVRQ